MTLTDWLEAPTDALLEEIANDDGTFHLTWETEFGYMAGFTGGPKSSTSGWPIEVHDPDLRTALAKLIVERAERARP